MSQKEILLGPKKNEFGPSLAVDLSATRVEAPAFEGLSVTVPTPDDLTQDDLLERFRELKRQVSPRRTRRPNEAIDFGDDIVFDALGYSEGKLIPFSARFDVRMELAPLAALPGFSEGLQGAHVGESREIAVDLPENYPVEALRGKPVRFIVDVKSAEAVRELGDGDPDLIGLLKRGATLDEVMDSIAEELENEAAEVLQVEGREMVFDELIARTQATVAPSVVDEEIRLTWQRLEGAALAEKNFDAEEQREALNGWLADPETREQTERRLKLSMVLGAIAKKEKIFLDAAKLEEILQEASTDFGLTAQQVSDGLRAPNGMNTQVYNVALHLATVQHVLQRTRITFAAD
jgi:trigger factor